MFNKFLFFILILNFFIFFFYIILNFFLVLFFVIFFKYFFMLVKVEHYQNCNSLAAFIIFFIKSLNLILKKYKSKIINYFFK